MDVELNKIWGIYLETFRLHSHQLLAWAYADSCSSLHCERDEPAVTGLLCDAMKARLNRPDTPEEYDRYAIGDQEPVSPFGQLGVDRLKLDICITRSGSRPRLAYIFEAKRLRTNGFSIGKYVGDSGVGDFIECRYGAGCPEAAMVGLIQNRDVAYWHRELNRAFTEARTTPGPQLEVVENLSPANVLDSLPNELQSSHRRRDSSQIKV